MFNFLARRKERLRKAKEIQEGLAFVQEQLSAPHVQAYLDEHPEELAEIEAKVTSIHSKMIGTFTFKA